MLPQPAGELKIGQCFRCRPAADEVWMKIESAVYHKGKVAPNEKEDYFKRDAVLLTTERAGQLGFFGDDFLAEPLQGTPQTIADT